MTLRQQGKSWAEISKFTGRASSTLRYRYKEAMKRMPNIQTDILKTMQTLTLRHKVVALCESLVNDVKNLGASKDEIQSRVSVINCVKNVVVAFELSTDAPPTTSTTQEQQIVADEVMAVLTPEQMEITLNRVANRMQTDPATNGGLIK